MTYFKRWGFTPLQSKQDDIIDELEQVNVATGIVTAAPMVDPTEPASVIATLKGILSQMQRDGLFYDEVTTICTAADTSAGVDGELSTYPAGWTLYLTAAAAVDVTVALSPDGTNWFDVEDTVDFAAAGDAIVEFGYHAHSIRLTGSNDQNVTAIVRGVF